jgi:hypothetical protein
MKPEVIQKKTAGWRGKQRRTTTLRGYAWGKVNVK